jgi:hypothetical protein
MNAKTHAECPIYLYRIVKKCVLQAVARLTRALTWSVNLSMNLPASGKHFVMVFNVRNVVSPSHGCQAATICVAGIVNTGSAMTVARH